MTRFLHEYFEVKKLTTPQKNFIRAITTKANRISRHDQTPKNQIHPRTKMKIALILERFDIERGGLERSTYEMACELTRQGMDVTIVAGRINRPPNESPLKFHEVPVKAKTRASWWRNFERAIRQYLQSSDFDISHSMTPIVWADIYQPRGGSILYSSIRHAEVLGDGLAAKLKRLAANFNFGRAARIDSEMILCRYPGWTTYRGAE